MQVANNNNNNNNKAQYFIKPNTLVTPDDPEALKNMIQERTKEKDTNKLSHEINELFQPEKPVPAKSMTSPGGGRQATPTTSNSTTAPAPESQKLVLNQTASGSNGNTGQTASTITGNPATPSGTSAALPTTLPEAELKALLEHLPNRQAESGGVLPVANNQQLFGGAQQPTNAATFATSVVSANPAALFQQQQQNDNSDALPREFAQLLANAGADSLLKSLQNPEPRSPQPQQQQPNTNNMIQSNLQGFNSPALTRQLYNNDGLSNPENSAYASLHNNPAVEYIARALASTHYPGGKRGSVLGYHRNENTASQNQQHAEFLVELKNLMAKYGGDAGKKKQWVEQQQPMGSEKSAPNGIASSRFKIKVLNRKRKRSAIHNKKPLTKRHPLSKHHNVTEKPRDELASKSNIPNW